MTTETFSKTMVEVPDSYYDKLTGTYIGVMCDC